MDFTSERSMITGFDQAAKNHFDAIDAFLQHQKSNDCHSHDNPHWDQFL